MGGRLCTVCAHPQRAEIDAALTAPDAASIRAIACQFNVGRMALHRHAVDHVPERSSASVPVYEAPRVGSAHRRRARGVAALSRARRPHAASRLYPGLDAHRNRARLRCLSGTERDAIPTQSGAFWPFLPVLKKARGGIGKWRKMTALSRAHVETVQYRAIFPTIPTHEKGGHLTILTPQKRANRTTADR
jgi:hypothetical protein